ncbi:dihydroorotase [Devosia neptuniae]|jgi:dihydroorotase|uniref:dihydroorotase n=1 Tax=Devosia TaxID=46913 RepID=UPI0022AF09A5|nr:dihydroorotase [Devosia neptuniae]MCZ4344698.1 dihydroorotase [Devosia neptuniae]|tara:strand:- start:3916 stop:5250 length:1335 start_codon:yes stop_codon:yes gene_type:complete
MAQYDTIFKNATLVNHDGEGRADVAVLNGTIAALGDLSGDSATETVDCTGLHILPGVIDTQVHFREPGLTHKEDLQSGSLSAVMGGVTGVFEMPNTNPLTTSRETFEAKIAAGTNRMHCDFAFYIGGTHENVGELAELERLPGCAGIKVFMGSSTGSLLVADDDGVEAILNAISRRAAFHSEDEFMLEQRKGLRVEGDPSSHPVWRSPEVALNCTKRLVGLAHKTGKRIHVLHISTAEEMVYLADHKDVASVEVTPHHLTLDETAYDRLGTYVQMNPPVRDAQHRAGIWAGVANGVADILGSDHAPHTREEKDHPYPASHSGMTGVQTLVPIMLDHVNAGKLSLQRFVDMTSAGPNRLFGIAEKGRVAVGYDADLTIVDLKRRETIRNADVKSRAGWTPYDGVTVTGWPVGTIVRGKTVMWQGELVTPSTGQPIRFLEALTQDA